MRPYLAAALLLVTASCQEITAADGPSVYVTLTPKPGSAACFIADPEPASVREDRGIAFINKSSMSITLILVEDGEDLPLVSVPPNDTSSAVKFRSAGLRQYYSQACGSGLSELHTLAVTVN